MFVISVGSIAMTLPKIIRLEVSLKDARVVEELRSRVEELRSRVEELEARNAELEALNNRYQFDLVCQQKINLQLQDYCRAEGYQIPKRLFSIWKSQF